VANTNKAFGLRPVGSLTAACYTGKTRQYYVPATDNTAIFIGDAVKLAGSSGSVNPDDANYPTATVATAGDAIIGVCVGIKPVPTDLSINYRKASTAMYIEVEVDPNTIYEVQGDSTVWAVGDVGYNATMTVGSGNTATGRSTSVATGPANTNTIDFQILGFSPTADNEIGAYSRLLVRLNDHQFINQTTGL
jgi:hypothetical protein